MTRIFMPLRSSRDRIGRLLVVKFLKPELQKSTPFRPFASRDWSSSRPMGPSRTFHIAAWSGGHRKGKSKTMTFGTKSETMAGVCWVTSMVPRIVCSTWSRRPPSCWAGKICTS
jgi:hypothetical protein